MEKTFKFLGKCPFCTEIHSPSMNPLSEYGIKTRIIFESTDWFVVPTVGSFVEQYLLIISKLHYPCVQALSHDYIDDLYYVKSCCEKLIKNVTSKDSILFEHGTLDPSYKSANSVDHAHIHIMPIDRPIWNDILREFNITNYLKYSCFKTMIEFISQKQIESYLWFVDVDGKTYLIPNGEMYPSQFFRQALATLLNYKGDWDWKVCPNYSNMMRTLCEFQEHVIT